MDQKISNSQFKKQLFWTNGCYRAALLEHYWDHLSKKERRLSHRQLHLLITIDWRENIDPEVGIIYKKKLLELESYKLSIIVQAFQTGQQHRNQETVDAIMTELFERSANPETKEPV